MDETRGLFQEKHYGHITRWNRTLVGQWHYGWKLYEYELRAKWIK